VVITSNIRNAHNSVALCDYVYINIRIRLLSQPGQLVLQEFLRAHGNLTSTQLPEGAAALRVGVLHPQTVCAVSLLVPPEGKTPRRAKPQPLLLTHTSQSNNDNAPAAIKAAQWKCKIKIFAASFFLHARTVLLFPRRR
jgi:hypothetical protein